jgi:hypothetical protein
MTSVLPSIDVDTGDLEVNDLDISTSYIREAILFAVAHGWRAPSSKVFSDEEAPTSRMVVVLP